MKKTKKHFTILEILAAVFILAIGLISILAVFPASMAMGTRVNEITMSSRAAKTARAAAQYYLSVGDMASANTNLQGDEGPLHWQGELVLVKKDLTEGSEGDFELYKGEVTVTGGKLEKKYTFFVAPR